MNLSEIFIRRPIMTILVMVAILFFGILSYKTLPVSDLPSVEYPTIQVSVSYPGANPLTVANNITSPLELEFLTIDGIQTISSTSTTGSSTIVIQFVLEKPIETAAQDVQAAIIAATPQLPQNLPYAPTYSKVNPSATPIFFFSLSSPTIPLSKLYEYGYNTIGQRLSTLEGVSQVITYGSPFSVRVQVDPQKLAARGIGIDEVATAIQNQNVNDPTGVLYGASKEYVIDVDGQLYEGEKYESLIIKSQNGAVVRVKDVGRALDSLHEDKYYLHYVDKEVDEGCVILAVRKLPTGNTIQILDQIHKLLPMLQNEIPSSIKISPLLDMSFFIKEALIEVKVTLLIAIGLVVLVIFFYLGKAVETIIPSIAIPMSIIGTFIILSFFGFTINILSLLAITLSVGFLVDDAIVVLENISRHIESGLSPLEAALKGSKEISITILSVTICLGSVFIPFLFMEGIIGRLFHEFAVTILTAVLLSGAISLSLTPMLCSRFMSKQKSGSEQNKIQRISYELNRRMVEIYKKTLVWTFKHPKVILSTGILSLILTIFLANTLPRDFLPGNNLGVIQGFTQANDNTSPFQMATYQKKITEIIREQDYYESIVSFSSISTNDNEGAFFINLKKDSERPSLEKILSSLYPLITSIPGVKIFMRPFPLIDLDVGTSASKGDYQYALQSLREKDLYHYAPIMFEKMHELPGFSQLYTDLQDQQPQLKIHILRDRASMLNVSASAIENTLNYAFAGSNLSPINEPQNQYYVILEVLPEFYKDPSKLSQLYVRSSTGELVPLEQVVSIEETTGPITVNHLNGLPSVSISFNLEKTSLSSALQSLDSLAKKTLPATITGSVQGTANVFLSSFANLNILLLITIFIIYIILGILYENFFHPLTVMSTLPPAAFGGMLTLLIFKETLSLYSFVGIVMLLGIVLKNGIIMIDFANQARIEQGKSIEEAIMDACLIRFRPILMTTVSAFMGAVPIAIGIGGAAAKARASLGLVILGGLLLSQVLTLYLTPLIYIYLERLRKKISRV